MKPKVLMYLYNYYPFENANTNVMLPIIEALKKRYTVEIFTANVDGTAPMEEQMNGVRVYRAGMQYSKMTRLKAFAIQVYDASEHGVQAPCKALKRFILRVFHGLVPAAKIDRMRIVQRTQTMASLIEKGEYAAVITVAAPVITHFEVLPLAKNGFLKEKNIKWFAYFSDPYSTFIGHAAQRSDYMKQESEVYQWADGVFTTPEIAADNLQYPPLAQYAAKTFSVQLANLVPIKPKNAVSYLDKSKINCVYMGSFINLAVRNPEYFYQIVQQCPPDIAFHIVCYFENEESRALREKYLAGLPNVHWHQRATMQECQDLMCAADILINLGNLCTNQTPSKIFDYIGVGGPVVNFHAIEQDTSKKYLEPYPLKLNMMAKPVPNKEDAEAFTQFCRANKGRRVPFADVENLYKDCLAANVAKAFIEKFDYLVQAD